jgi:hypothetical protein
MMKRTFQKPKSTKMFFVRAFIWVVLIAVVGGAYNASGISSVQKDLQAERVALSTQTAAFDGVVTYGVSQGGLVEGGVVTAGSTDGGCQTASTCEDYLAARYQGRELELLPAFRWANSGTLTDTFGWRDIVPGIMSGIGQLLLNIAAWVWWLLLGLVSMGARMDPLFSNSIGLRVNTLFYGISQGVSAGFVWFACVASVLVSIFAPLRGKGAPSIISVIIGFAVPLGLMWSMTTAANPSNTTVATGSPVWFGRQGVEMLDGVTGFATDQMNRSLSGVIINDTISGTASGVSPSCGAYTSALHNTFTKAWGSDVVRTTNSDSVQRTVVTLPGQTALNPATGVVQLQSNGKGGAGTLIAASALWETAYLPQWIAAEFGQVPLAYRTYCHYMELERGTSGPEQATIGVIAKYPKTNARTIDAPLQTTSNKSAVAPVANRVKIGNKFVYLNPDGTPSSTVPPTGSSQFTPPLNVDDAISSPALGPYRSSTFSTAKSGKEGFGDLLMWAACTDKAAGTDPTFSDLTNDNVWRVDGQITPETCKAWWAGTPANLLEYNEDPSVGRLRGIPCTPLPSRPEATDCGSHIATAILSSHGKNPGPRFFGAMVALVTAVLYFWVLGMVSIGVIVAKIGFIAMLMILPITLFLLAVPKWRVDPKRSQRLQIGTKLLKQTMGFAAASAVFQLMCVMLIMLIGLVRSIILVLPLGASFADVVTPLVALFLAKKLMKKAGLGDLTNPSGAMGLAAAAAAGLGGGGMKAAKEQANKNANSKMAKASDMMADNMSPAGLNSKRGTEGKYKDGAVAAATAAAALDAASQADAKKAKNAADKTKDPAELAALQRQQQKDKTQLGKDDAVAAGDLAAKENAKALGETTTDHDAKRAAAEAALAGGKTMDQQRLEKDGAAALGTAAAAISAASAAKGGTVSTADAAAGLASGAYAGMVERADGTMMSVGAALADGVVGMNSQGSMVALEPGATMHQTRTAAEAGSAARSMDPAFSAVGATAAAAATSAGLGGAHVGAVRGHSGVVLPSAGGSGIPGQSVDISAPGGIGDSVAAASLAFSPSAVKQVYDAVGAGNHTAAAAVFQEALALNGYEGSSLSSVCESLSAASGHYPSAMAMAEDPSQFAAFRSACGIDLSGDQVSQCVAGAVSNMQSYASADAAVYAQPVAAAREKAEEHYQNAQAALNSGTPDQKTIAHELAQMDAYLAVAQEGQSALSTFCASGGMVRPDGASSFDVGQYTRERAQFYSEQLSHSAPLGGPVSATETNSHMRAVGNRVLSSARGPIMSVGGVPPIGDPTAPATSAGPVRTMPRIGRFKAQRVGSPV